MSSEVCAGVQAHYLEESRSEDVPAGVIRKLDQDQGLACSHSSIPGGPKADGLLVLMRYVADSLYLSPDYKRPYLTQWTWTYTPLKLT